MKNFEAMEIEFNINYKINHKISFGTRFLNKIDGINYKLTEFDLIAHGISNQTIVLFFLFYQNKILNIG
ncbi:MAG: hypothetical protein ACL7AX_11445 [Candidatus Arsenophonus phytopathogenicus]